MIRDLDATAEGPTVALPAEADALPGANALDARATGDGRGGRPSWWRRHVVSGTHREPGGEDDPAAFPSRRRTAAGGRLPWRQAARIMLAMGFGSWGLVALLLALLLARAR